MTPHDAARELTEKASYYTATVGGTATGVMSWLSDNWLGLGGFVIAALGLAVNWYYKHCDELRKREQHEKAQ